MIGIQWIGYKKTVKDLVHFLIVKSPESPHCIRIFLVTFLV